MFKLFNFSDVELVRIAIFFLGFAGFLVARHIFEEKKAERPLVCPIRFDCDTVVHSDYSKFMGVRVEILGMFYYAFIALSYLVFLFKPEFLPNAVVGAMATLSLVAFLFSVYLIAVQIFILKKMCSWCIVSSFICILIFTLTILAYDFTVLVENFVK
jgi:uncharacterized membrane protein